jgi:competence protein ComEC
MALAFAAGIALGARPAAGWVLLGAAGALAAAWAVRRRPAFLGLALLCAAAVSGLLWQRASARPGADSVDLLSAGGQTLVGTVLTAPAYSDGTWRFVLGVERHEHGARTEARRGRCYVRLRSSREVTRGERLRLTGEFRPLHEERNPGGASERRRLASYGVRSVLTVNTDDLVQSAGTGELGWMSRHAYQQQRRILVVLARHVHGPYPELTAAVAASVIFGVHAAPPPAEISDAFRRAGTIHLLVVSGSMVSLVCLMVFLPGRLGAAWRRRQESSDAGAGRGRIAHRPGVWAAAAAIGVVLYYAALTEGGQAVWRAATMGVFAGAAFGLKRVPPVARHHGLNVDAYTLLAAAGLVLLIGQPEALLLPGFQLSFAAVWAIVFLTPKLEAALSWGPRWLSLSLGATLAAQLATFPILTWHYGNAPIAGLAANVLAMPLASVVLVAGMATCLLGFIAPGLAGLTGWVTGWSTRGLIWVSTAFASLPWAAPELPRPSEAVVVAWYAGLVAVGAVLSQRDGDRQRISEQHGNP